MSVCWSFGLEGEGRKGKWQLRSMLTDATAPLNRNESLKKDSRKDVNKADTMIIWDVEWIKWLLGLQPRRSGDTVTSWGGSNFIAKVKGKICVEEVRMHSYKLLLVTRARVSR